MKPIKERLVDIISTILVTFAAMAIRDAIVLECHRCKYIREMSPLKFAAIVALLATIIIWILHYPLKNYILGEKSIRSFYDTLVGVIVSVCLLLSALAIRDASIVYLEKNKLVDKKKVWMWPTIVTLSAIVVVVFAAIDDCDVK